MMELDDATELHHLVTELRDAVRALNDQVDGLLADRKWLVERAANADAAHIIALNALAELNEMVDQYRTIIAWVQREAAICQSVTRRVLPGRVNMALERIIDACTETALPL